MSALSSVVASVRLERTAGCPQAAAASAVNGERLAGAGLSRSLIVPVRLEVCSAHDDQISGRIGAGDRDGKGLVEFSDVIREGVHGDGLARRHRGQKVRVPGMAVASL